FMPLSDADIGLSSGRLSDADIGLGASSGRLSDTDIGLGGGVQPLNSTKPELSFRQKAGVALGVLKDVMSRTVNPHHALQTVEGVVGDVGNIAGKGVLGLMNLLITLGIDKAHQPLTSDNFLPSTDEMT